MMSTLGQLTSCSRTSYHELKNRNIHLNKQIQVYFSLLYYSLRINVFECVSLYYRPFTPEPYFVFAPDKFRTWPLVTIPSDIVTGSHHAIMTLFFGVCGLCLNVQSQQQQNCKLFLLKLKDIYSARLVKIGHFQKIFWYFLIFLANIFLAQNL